MDIAKLLDFQVLKQLTQHEQSLLDVALWHLLPFFLIIIFIAGIKRIQMTSEEEFSHIWFIFNGATIHIFMDGLVGGLKFCKPLYAVYSQIDLRYKEQNNLVHLICWIEILFMGPLCLYVGRLFAKEKTIKREVLSIVVSTVQITGAVFFVGQEILRNFVDVCQEGSCMTFTWTNIIYFWIVFVVCNFIWVFVPLNEIEKATQNIMAFEENKQKSLESSFDKNKSQNKNIQKKK